MKILGFKVDFIYPSIIFDRTKNGISIKIEDKLNDDLILFECFSFKKYRYFKFVFLFFGFIIYK